MIILILNVNLTNYDDDTWISLHHHFKQTKHNMCIHLTNQDCFKFHFRILFWKLIWWCDVTIRVSWWFSSKQNTWTMNIKYQSYYYNLNIWKHKIELDSRLNKLSINECRLVYFMYRVEEHRVCTVEPPNSMALMRLHPKTNDTTTKKKTRKHAHQ